MNFLYQLGSLSSERMMSKDSKNGFGSSVAKVVNSKEVGEVQEGATCFCDKKLSKFG